MVDIYDNNEHSYHTHHILYYNHSIYYIRCGNHLLPPNKFYSLFQTLSIRLLYIHIFVPPFHPHKFFVGMFKHIFVR